MEDFIDDFLRNRFWRWMVRLVGPTLTLKLILYLKVPVWGWEYYRHGKHLKLLHFLFGVQPNALAHPSFYPHLVYRYDCQMVPKKARRLNPALFLVKIIFYVLRIRFAWNVAVGTGHNTVELDYFFRLHSQGLAGTRAILLRRPNPYHDASIDLYRDKFWLASNNPVLCDLLFPLAVGTEKLRIDCGLARGKYQLRPDGSYDPPPPGQSHLIEITKTENIAQWVKYYALRSRTENEFPLADGIEIDQELTDFLKNKGNRIALIHMKLHVINATAAPSDPAAYELAIRWLLDSGYQVVFVGREPFPPSFAALGVLNYSESSIASYKHDVQLFAKASLAITAGSGISCLPDCMGKSYVYLDSWHLAMPMPSRRCVMVPALVKDRKAGRFLTLVEQLQLYLGLPDKGGERFPAESYEPRNADPEEVLHAVHEVLSLEANPGPLSPIQRRYADLLPPDFQPVVNSRASQFFLERHSDLLPN